MNINRYVTLFILLILLVGTANAATVVVRAIGDLSDMQLKNTSTNLNVSQIRIGNGTGVTNTTSVSGAAIVAGSVSGRYATISRYAWCGNASASGLPASAVNLSATFSVYADSASSTTGIGNISSGLINFNPTNPLYLTLDDFNKTSFIRYTNATDDKRQNLSWNAAGWNTWQLNANATTNISMTGTTCLMMSWKGDIENSTSEVVNWNSGGYSKQAIYDYQYGLATAANMTITYDLPSSNVNVSFYSNATTGMTPTRGIQFNDTSSNITGVVNKIWRFRDYSGNAETVWADEDTSPHAPRWNNFSWTNQSTPAYTFGSGNWSIELDVYNGTWYNSTANYSWVNVSAGRSGTTRLAGNYKFYPADSIWYQNVSALPIHPSSSTWLTKISTISPTLTISTFNEGSQGTYFIVNDSIVREPLLKTNTTTTYKDWGYFPGQTGYPIPDDAVTSATAGSDHWMELIDTTNNIVYSMSNTRKKDNGTWEATGTIFNYSSYCYRFSTHAGNNTDNGCNYLGNKWYTWSGSTPTPRQEQVLYYPSDSGLPMYPIALRYEEVATGYVNHTIAATIHMADDSGIYPAVGAGEYQPNAHCNDGTCPPVGAIFRLNASYNVSAHGLGTQAKVIAQTLKTYGAIVPNTGTDNSINFFGIADANWNGTDLNTLKTGLTLADFDFVDVSSIMLPNGNYTMQSTNATLSPLPINVSAGFTADITGGTTPLTVSFTDTSTNSPIGWNWSFQNVTPGNNTQIWWSTSQNPTKVFTTGNYKIVLNASNSTGYNITPSAFWINVSAVPAGNYTTVTQRFYAPTTAADGRITNDTSTSYAVKRSSQGNVMLATASTVISVSGIAVSSPPVNTTTSLVRFFISYDTSGIPDSAIIQSAAAGFVGDEYSTNAAGNVSVGITGFSPQTPDTLQVTDYNRFGNQTYSSTYINVNDWVAGENTFPLNSYGRDAINKTGLTPVALRLKDDILGTDSEFIYISSGYSVLKGFDTSAGGSLRPFMDVTYQYEVEPASVFFTSNKTTCAPICGVYFEDTSTSFTPTQRVWRYKDYSTLPMPFTRNWNNFGTSSTASQTFGAGNWSIELDRQASNGSWYNTSTGYKFINVSAGNTGGLRLNGTYIPYPEDSIWRQKVDTLSVHPNSGTWVSQMVTDAGTDTVGYYGMTEGAPYFVVNSSISAQLFGDNNQTGTYPAWYDYGSVGGHGGFQIPDDVTVQTGGSDNTFDLFDVDNGILFATSNNAKQSNGIWSGGAHTIFNLSSYCIRFSAYSNGTDNGCNWLGNKWYDNMATMHVRSEGSTIFYPNDAVIPPSLNIRYEEVASGAINHTMFGTIHIATGHTYPAVGGGTDGGVNSPPVGVIVRLKASKDISGFDPQSKVIAQALKTYGAVVVNTGGGNALVLDQFTSPYWNAADLGDLNSIHPSTDLEIVNITPLIRSQYSYQANVTTVANFTKNQTSGTAPLAVSFTDTSTNVPESWQWNATDVTGTNIPFTFSIVKNPTYTFNAGNWSIKLKASKWTGSNITPASYFVNVSSSGGVIPSANFTGTPLNISTGQSVQFTDTSNGIPTSWKWCFGDDDSCDLYGHFDDHTGMYPVQSTLQNPSHTYSAAGSYTVSMMALNALGSNVVSKVNYINVTSAPVIATANFNPRGSYNIIDPQCIHMGYACTYEYQLWVEGGTSIAYQSTSTNADTLAWTGTNESGSYYGSGNNFTVYYSAAGAYTINLQASNSYTTSNATTRIFSSDPPVTPIPIIYGNVTNMPVAHATSPATFGVGSDPFTHIDIYAGDTVQFEDVGYNNPISLHWEINAGNGSTYSYDTSYATPVSFTYSNPSPGSYPVRLISTNDAGTATVDAPLFINVLDTTPPPALFNITSTPGISSIIWNWTYPGTKTYIGGAGGSGYFFNWEVNQTLVYKNGVYYETINYWDQVWDDTNSPTLPTGGTTWMGLAPNTSYMISTRTVDAAGNINLTWSNSTVSTSNGIWNWSTGGTYNWTCPADVTSISVILVGGGGSGKGGSNNGANGVMRVPYAGTGGEPGEIKTISQYTVVPGQTYQIFIGRGGANSTYGSASNPGTITTAFSTNANPGAGGVAIQSLNGGDGQSGYGTTRLAINGTAGSTGSGGTGGLGNGASGGGGGQDLLEGTTGGSIGGMGADGLVKITVSGFQGGNIPDFIGNPTTSSPGTLVKFTDLSTIADPVGVTYNWSFGDAGASLTPYSSEVGDVNHVYTYLGVYDVSLTITNPNGTFTETKHSYIVITTSDSGKINTLYPREVSFTLVDKYGRAIADLPVTATMTSSSVENTNWLTSMFGLTDSSINSTVLSDTTDDTGQVVFPMIASGRYHMTFIDLSRGVNEARDVHPSQTNYIYILSTSATAIAEASADFVNISLSTSPPASEKPSTVYLIANYTDLSGTTSVIRFVVKHPSNGTVIYNTTYNSQNSLNVSYAVSNTMSNAYIWELNATTTKFGKQSKAMGITLPGSGANGLASNLFKEGCTSWKCD